MIQLRHLATSAAFVCIAIGSAFCQTGQVVAGFVGSAGGGVPFRPITGKPYSADQVTERSQTLADGTHIVQPLQTAKMFRDSAGRTRVEHQFAPPPGMGANVNLASFVQITDPLAGYSYNLNTGNHEAHRTPWPPEMRRLSTPAGGTTAPNRTGVLAPSVTFSPNFQSPPQQNGPSAAASRPRQQFSTESLGTQMIEGVLATGRRTTITYPEGYFGNDRPITTVSESWNSVDLQMLVLSRNSDPRSGETTTRLTNLSQSEPDPALFQLPADAAIIDAGQPSAPH